MEDIRIFRCSLCGAQNRVPLSRLQEKPICGRCKSLINTSPPPMIVDEFNFEGVVIKSKIPVLADFWAPWCGPCHIIAPVIESLAKKYAGRILFVKINIDENSNLASSYNIRGIPSLLIFRGGKEINRLVGSVPEYEIEKLIFEALGV